MINKSEALENVLRRISVSIDFPVISKYLIEINQKISDDTVYTSASELANIIIKDYALTNKLLKLINSAFYGVIAGKVTTVSRAVILLGYDNVRLVAGSLILFEHFQNKSNARDMKEAVTHCFWCGLMAREIALLKKLRGPEEAYICAMLHDLGRLLAILHMYKEYKAIGLKMVQNGTDEHRAAQTVLGVDFCTIGKQVAASWGFPKKIRECMTPLTVKELKSNSKRIDSVHALTLFANQLGHGLVAGSPEQVGETFSGLCGIYKHALGIDEKELNKIAGNSLDMVRNHAEALQLNIGNSRFLSCLERYCDSLKNTKGPSKKTIAPASAQNVQPCRFSDIDTEQSVVLPDKCATDPIAVLLEGLQEVISTMAVDPDINNIAIMSMEIIYRALKFNRVVLFIQDTAGKTMKARYGFGNGLVDITGKVEFKIDKSKEDIFSMAINYRKDLVVDNMEDKKNHDLTPAWYKNAFKAGAFIFFPIMFKHICLGAIYADRKQPGLPISELEHRYVGMLRNQMIMALKFCK